MTAEFSNVGETLLTFSRAIMSELVCEKLVRVSLYRMGEDKLDSGCTILNSFKEFCFKCARETAVQREEVE